MAYIDIPHTIFQHFLNCLKHTDTHIKHFPHGAEIHALPDKDVEPHYGRKGGITFHGQF